MTLPREPSLKIRARALRRNQTEAEKMFWNIVRHQKIKGYRFLRQKNIFSYIVDFYCPILKLIVEIDGPIHQKQEEEDRLRTQHLEDLGLTIIRYTNDQILHQTPLVIVDLKQCIASLESSPPFGLPKGGAGGGFGVGRNDGMM